VGDRERPGSACGPGRADGAAARTSDPRLRRARRRRSRVRLDLGRDR
jgi:hypothetical protein